MSEELSREDIDEAVERVVGDLLDAANVTSSPVDALALATKHLGMRIRTDGPARRGRVRSNGANEIVLPRGLNAEQTQWAIARAVGTFLKPRILERIGVTPAEQKGLMGVSVAELFAVRLLLPTRWFVAEARARDFDVAQLQSLFATAGADVVAWRLLDLDEPCAITIVDNDAVVRRRSNAWRLRAGLSPAEQECQRYVNHYSRPHVVQSRGWTVHGWPVHRSDWKREILRSVVDDESMFEEEAQREQRPSRPQSEDPFD